MQLERVHLRGIGSLKDFSVDFREFGEASIIAVTGDNGVGKSTFLEASFPGALFRETPTRGSLTALATSRSSMVETTFRTDREYTARHLLDGTSGKAEALLLRDGVPLGDSAKVREFDATARRLFASPEVLFSSVFGVQGAEGFIGLKSADRKAVLLRALGLERLEEFAAEAREKAKTAKSAVDAARARLAEAESGQSSDDARRELVAAEASVADAETKATAARTELEGARLEAADHTLAKRRYDEELARWSSLTQRRQAIEASLNDASARLANNRAVLDDADRIRDAVAKSTELQSRLTSTTEELSTRKSAAALWQRDHELAKAKLSASQRKLETARKQQEELSSVESSMPELREKVSSATARVADAEMRVRELSDAALVGADGRISMLRDALSAIDASGDASLAREALANDDNAALAALNHPAAMAEAQEELGAAKSELATASSNLAVLERSAARLPTAESLRDEVSSSESESQAALEEVARLESSRDVGIPTIEVSLATLREKLLELEPLVKRAGPLESAEGRVAELTPRIAELTAERDAVAAELESCPEPAPPGTPPELAALESKASELAALGRNAVANLGAAKARVDAAEAAERRAEDVRTELHALEAEHSDWVRLSHDLGRDGLQAAEIDAAGPELTTLVNDLLHTCVGPRWTVSIETTRLSSDGKRQIEGCEVRVLDTHTNREAEASTFSGGERVIIGEAVGLALSMLSCRKSGITGATLVRDESGAALSAKNLRVYVAMLRRAAKLVGARHVLFVCHSPQAVELADARIEVVADNSGKSVA